MKMYLNVKIHIRFPEIQIRNLVVAKTSKSELGERVREKMYFPGIESHRRSALNIWFMTSNFITDQPIILSLSYPLVFPDRQQGEGGNSRIWVDGHKRISNHTWLVGVVVGIQNSISKSNFNEKHQNRQQSSKIVLQLLEPEAWWICEREKIEHLIVRLPRVLLIELYPECSVLKKLGMKSNVGQNYQSLRSILKQGGPKDVLCSNSMIEECDFVNPDDWQTFHAHTVHPIIARRAIVFARYRLGHGKRCVNRVCLCLCPCVVAFWPKEVLSTFGVYISGVNFKKLVRVDWNLKTRIVHNSAF